MGWRTTAACLAGLLVLSGCSQGPDGGREVEVGHLTLSVPQGWTEEPASGQFDKKWVGDEVELQVSGSFSTDPTASAAYGRLDLPATLQLDGYRGQGAKKHEVPGADTAVRADFTYDEAGEPRSGTWIVAGQWPYPSTAVVTLTGADLDTEDVRGVIDSLHFDKTTGKDGSPT